jgi:hypothetical protein
VGLSGKMPPHAAIARGDLNCPVPQNSLIINEPARSLSAPQN